MERSEVISCNVFNDHFGSHCNSGHSSSAVKGLSVGLIGSHSPTDVISEDFNSCASNTYDEYFDVNSDKEELRKLLANIKCSSRLSLPRSLVLDLPKSDNFGFVTKSLGEVTGRTFHHSVDKYYDESDHVHAVRGYTKNEQRADKLSLISRPVAARLPIRRLEDVIYCPSGSIPRQTSYSSSSGSLIGNIDSLSFQPDGVVMSGGSQSVFHPSFTLDRLMESDESDPDKGPTSQFRRTHSVEEDQVTRQKLPSETKISSTASTLHNSVEHSNVSQTPPTLSTDRAPDILSSAKPHGPVNCLKDSTPIDDASNNLPNESQTKYERSLQSSRYTASRPSHLSPLGYPTSAELDSDFFVSENEDRPRQPDSASTVDAGDHSTDLIDMTATMPAMQGSPSNTAESIIPASPEYLHTGSGSADEEFTLVTGRKHRRKQKHQSRQTNDGLYFPRTNHTRDSSAGILLQRPSVANDYASFPVAQRFTANRFPLQPTRTGASSIGDRTKVRYLNPNHSVVKSPLSFNSSSFADSVISDKYAMVQCPSRLDLNRCDISEAGVSDQTASLSATLSHNKKPSSVLKPPFCYIPLPNADLSSSNFPTSKPEQALRIFGSLTSGSPPVVSRLSADQHEHLITFLFTGWNLFKKQYASV
ncbi:unnamed protein product [Dicrocoelium dendriticum]|nr:unnamed protein product [Dicrocoelium dendriticum]